MTEPYEQPTEAAEVPAIMPPDMTDLAEQLVAAAADKGVDLTGENGLLTALTKQVLQSALEVEMGHHLGYDAVTRWAAIAETHGTGRRRRRSLPTSAK